MNWLQKIATWQERGLDAGEHLHQAFMVTFRTTDAPKNVFEHVDSGLIYYLSNSYSGTSRGGGRAELGFEPTTTFEYKNFGFVFDDCMYRLEVPLGSSTAFDQNPSLGDKMKMIDVHNLVGTLVRIFDIEVGQEHAKIGVVRGSDPLQFSTSIESMIKSDRDDNDFEESLEPEPDPGLYENDPDFEDELNMRDTRIRGLRL